MEQLFGTVMEQLFGTWDEMYLVLGTFVVGAIIIIAVMFYMNRQRKRSFPEGVIQPTQLHTFSMFNKISCCCIVSREVLVH